MGYFQHPSMSRSQLFDLSKMTPFKWYSKYVSRILPSKITEALIFGSAFHCYILENYKFYDEFIVVPKFNLSTKVGKADKQKFFEENDVGDKSIISEKSMALILKMEESLLKHNIFHIINQATSMEEEFYFKLHNIDFKAKLDIVNKDKDQIFDLKTCSGSFINEEDFSREMIKYGNDLQVYIYSQAYKSKYGKIPTFFFICTEKELPYETQIFQAKELYKYGEYRTIKLIEKYKDLLSEYGREEWIDTYVKEAKLSKYHFNEMKGK